MTWTSGTSLKFSKTEHTSQKSCIIMTYEVDILLKLEYLCKSRHILNTIIWYVLYLNTIFFMGTCFKHPYLYRITSSPIWYSLGLDCMYSTYCFSTCSIKKSFNHQHHGLTKFPDCLNKLVKITIISLLIA